MFRVMVRREPVDRVLILGCVGLLGIGLSGCGNDEFVRPPDPIYVRGEIAPPTVASGESAGGLSEPVEIGPDDVEADQVPAEGEGDPGQMVLSDDAGQTVVNDEAWGVFDMALSSQLVPANSAASVAVMVDGQLIHSAAFGTRVPGTTDPIDTGDRFRVASISKTISSITALQLVDDGQLSLDAPVGRVIADYLGMGDIDPDAERITLRQLLSHTSGFGEHYSTFFGGTVGSCSEAGRIGLSNVGGAGGFDYSNMNYCLVGLLIEAVTGKAYERVVQERLLVPLGIVGMRWTSTFELGPDEVSHYPTPGRNYMEVLGGAGQWNATPSDLVRIYNSIDPKTPGWKALSPSGLAAIRYRVPSAGAPSGYGLGVINYGGGAWGHTGTIEHAHSMVLVQDNGVTWAVTVAGETPSRTGALRSMVARAMRTAFG